jgi:hypothetical protein
MTISPRFLAPPILVSDNTATEVSRRSFVLVPCLVCRNTSATKTGCQFVRSDRKWSELFFKPRTSVHWKPWWAFWAVTWQNAAIMPSINTLSCFSFRASLNRHSTATVRNTSDVLPKFLAWNYFPNHSQRYCIPSVKYPVFIMIYTYEKSYFGFYVWLQFIWRCKVNIEMNEITITAQSHYLTTALQDCRLLMLGVPSSTAEWGDINTWRHSAVLMRLSWCKVKGGKHGVMQMGLTVLRMTLRA